MNVQTYLDKVMEQVKKNHPYETEFIQAVEEVNNSLEPILKAKPELIEANILERLYEPERVIIFKVPWVDDNNNVQVNRGYRVQFNSALGPYKGGIRFSDSVNLSVIKFLGFEQIFKNALTGLPIGGGKGGSDFDSRNKSDGEILRFVTSFMMELTKHIGGNIDSPAGDVGVGAREIGYMFGAYKRLTNSYDAAGVTGKPQKLGGSILRAEATGYGAVYFAFEMLKDQDDTFKNKTVAVSGYGNVSWGVCKKVTELGGKVVTLSSRKGFVYDPDGVNTQEKFDFLENKIKLKDGSSLEDYATKFNCEYFENQKPWSIKTDLVMPCATQNEIDLEDAKLIVENKTKFVVEGANMPCTLAATKYFKQHGVLIGPAKAANAGGVSVSALEMSQNKMGYFWNEKEVDEKLQEIMINIYHTCKKAALDYGYAYDLVAGANISGFLKVSEAMIRQGQY